jgi:hypothetical protein
MQALYEKCKVTADCGENQFCEPMSKECKCSPGKDDFQPLRHTEFFQPPKKDKTDRKQCKMSLSKKIYL